MAAKVTGDIAALMAGRMAGLADSRVSGVTVLATLIQRAVERLPFLLDTRAAPGAWPREPGPGRPGRVRGVSVRCRGAAAGR